MGEAEEVFKRDQAAADQRRRQEQEGVNAQKRELVRQIQAAMQEVVEKLRRHEYADDPDYGLKRQGLKVDDVQRPVWWVTAQTYQTLQPMDHYYVTGDGVLVSHYGYSISMDEDQVRFGVDGLNLVLHGLRRLIDTEPQPEAAPAPAPRTPQHKSWWQRLTD